MNTKQEITLREAAALDGGNVELTSGQFATVADYRKALAAKSDGAQVIKLQVREIGGGVWRDASKESYEQAQRDPTMDYRTVPVTPTAAAADGADELPISVSTYGSLEECEAERKRRASRADAPLASYAEPGSREAAMVVIERNEQGVPTVWCDPEIVDLVTALNKASIRTVASCSGHGGPFGNIMLADGRELLILPSYEAARAAEKLLSTPAAAPQGVVLPPIERDEQINRSYIPLPGGWEVQTKGNGSTFRIAKVAEGGDFERWLVLDEKLHEPLERMAMDARAAVALAVTQEKK